MSILRRIQQMRASLSGGSFLLEASGDLAAGDVLLILGKQSDIDKINEK